MLVYAFFPRRIVANCLAADKTGSSWSAEIYSYDVNDHGVIRNTDDSRSERQSDAIQAERQP